MFNDNCSTQHLNTTNRIVSKLKRLYQDDYSFGFIGMSVQIVDVLINFYHIQSIFFVKACYWCDIGTIYENWKSFSRTSRKMEKEIFIAFENSKELELDAYGEWIEFICPGSNYSRAAKKELDASLLIYKPPTTLLLPSIYGYIATINICVIPQCIIQKNVKYCQPLSF
eukprot:UN07566